MKSKKRTVIIVGVIAFVVLIAAFGSEEHQHTWSSANCIAPKTCIECGETEGVALDHIWLAATCQNPRMCSQCNTTEGSALEHIWIEANCTTAKHCEDCGTESGVPLGHKVTKWTTVRKSTCAEAGLQEGTCTVCSEKVNKTLEKANHIDDNKWVVIKAPSYTSSGTKATHCKNCSSVMQEETFDLSLEEKNALRKAEDYLDFMAFSRSGLINQLVFEGFSKSVATTAVDSLNVNWNEQAAKKAQDYLDMMSFSRSALIKQLKFEGFTQEQAEYGVKAVGY